MSVAIETARVAERYDRRRVNGSDDRNDIAFPSRYLAHQEKEREFLNLLGRWPLARRRQLRVLEVGCGDGDNLLQFLRWGILPENLVGNELLEERCNSARRVLPAAVKIMPGDASQLQLLEESFDIVLQSTVFTSLLDDDFQQALADRMWSLVAPGGGVLWYDFAVNNPNNPDVRGVRYARIKDLFPRAKIERKRLTLAPPIARRVAQISPILYSILNGIPLLRTHLFCWLQKPAEVIDNG